MTQPESDRERMRVLLDRLAAVERERDDWKDTARAWIAANAPGGWIDDLRKAESALLSLQNAVRELMRAVHYVGAAGDLVLEIEGVFFRVDVRESSVGALGVERIAATHRLVERKTRLAALLPDTAGTTP